VIVIVEMMMMMEIGSVDERDNVDTAGEESCADHEKDVADADDVKPVDMCVACPDEIADAVAVAVVDKGIVAAVEVEGVATLKKKGAVMATSDRSENEDHHQPGSG